MCEYYSVREEKVNRKKVELLLYMYMLLLRVLLGEKSTLYHYVKQKKYKKHTGQTGIIKNS